MKIFRKILYCILFIALLSVVLTGCACDHVESDWIVDAEATYDSDGSKHVECTECGEILKTETIPEITLTSQEVRKKLYDSIVEVYAYDYDGTTLLSQGSGFFINKSGVFITNAHVVEDCYYLKARSKFATYDVSVMYVYNSVLDYAICKIDGYHVTTPVEFASKADVGDKVYAMGFPNGIISFTEGDILSTDTKDGVQDYYEITARIDHGSSGGILSDDKGRVLGITTGEFGNGNYAALKYSEFEKDIKTSYFGTKAPLDYFHTVKKVMLGSYNADTYFDVYVTANATSDTRVSYSITVALNDYYAKKKVKIDGISISITLKVDTEYQYYEVGNYFDSLRTQRDSTYVYCHFYNEASLISGDWNSASSSIFLSSFTDYYGMKISYDVDFFSANGTILIYD